jgi:hypothetical protein
MHYQVAAWLTFRSRNAGTLMMVIAVGSGERIGRALPPRAAWYLTCCLLPRVKAGQRRSLRRSIKASSALGGRIAAFVIPGRSGLP